jgi:hypothetical protein
MGRTSGGRQVPEAQLRRGLLSKRRCHHARRAAHAHHPRRVSHPALLGSGKQPRQDWILKCVQGGRAHHPLAACGLAGSRSTKWTYRIHDGHAADARAWVMVRQEPAVSYVVQSHHPCDHDDAARDTRGRELHGEATAGGVSACNHLRRTRHRSYSGRCLAVTAAATGVGGRRR